MPILKLAAVVGVALAVSAGAAMALSVITPVACGTAAGGAFTQYPNAFDNQPVWDDVLGAPVGTGDGHTGMNNYVGRAGYADLGENWADIRIYQTWTRFRPFSGGDQGGFAEVWWDDDNDIVNDGVTETTLNFGNALAVPNSATELWVMNASVTTPITPAGRYLMFRTDAASTGRANEFAIIGEIAQVPVIPEPVTLAGVLAGVASIGGYLRRRRA